MNEINIIASDEDEGKRVDRFLAIALSAHFSRRWLQKLMKQGAVICNGAVEYNRSTKIKMGDRFTITLPDPKPLEVKAQPIALDIVFEDDDIIVINKPVDLVVHPDSVHRDGTLVNALLHHCADSLSSIGGVERPGIVHRLDMQTSGLLVCAKTDIAHRSLADQFSQHGRDGKLKRAYTALVWGKPPPGPDIIDAPIGRHPIHRRKMMVRKHGSSIRNAQTEFRLIERVGTNASLLRCQLFTGRTHQIRVHLLSRGFPIIGDATYHLRKYQNPTGLLIKRQALHATHLGFIHPRTGEAISFKSALPADITAAINYLKQDMPTI